MKSLIFFVLLSAATLYANAGGIVVYVMKAGMPLGNTEVIIDAESTFRTDADGYLRTQLEEGLHQVQVVIKEEGKPLAYVKKSIAVEAERESQLIVSLKENNELLFADIEAPEIISADANASSSKAKENGTVQLQLRSAEDDAPIKNARIFAKGLSIDLKSDAKGYVEMTLPEGNQTLSIIHSDFSTQSLLVNVLPHETISKFVEMSPSAMELEEFVVLAPHVEGSLASTLSEVRNSEAVADVVGSEQFSKQGSSDAAAALKRVTGLTIVGGKYVYVRGLGERYSSTLLNGLELPSPEPTKRVVPLDMFPTSVIESMMIQKTYSPDLPGTFGGGTIKIRTKGTPDEGFVKLSLSTKYNEGATGQDGLTYEGGSSDWSGYDDGSRDLPSELLTATANFTDVSSLPAAQQIALGKQLADNRNIGTTTQTLMPGGKMQFTAGNKWELSDDIDLGMLFSFSYTNENDLRDFKRVSYTYAGGVTDGTIKEGGQNQLTTYHYQNSMLFGLESTLFEDHTLRYTGLYLHDTSDYVRSSDYYANSSDLYFDTTYLSWIERELFINQFNGEHKLGLDDAHTVRWGVEFGTANRYEPGTVEYDYEYDEGMQKYVLATSVSSPVKYSTNNLDDTLLNYELAYRSELDLFGDYAGKEFSDYVELGYMGLNKERSLESRLYSFTDGPNNDLYGDVDGHIDDLITGTTVENEEWVLGNRYGAGDFYDAEQSIEAFYLKYLTQPIASLEVMVGARQENSTQGLTTYYLDGDQVLSEYHELVTEDLLPALTLTYKPIKDLQLRAGYSNTLTRPDFREFSNNSYQDPVTGIKVFGNPGLEYTKITNYDLRAEYYFSATESISAALFHKAFDKPIETVGIEAGRPAWTFTNALSAVSTGVEIDFRKSLGFVADMIEDYELSGNIAIIESAVTVDPVSVSRYQLTTDDRPMQGQSPYVINLQFGYNHPDNVRNATLLYNVFGPRIRSLGTNQAPDTYEDPFHQLDFVWNEQISKSFKMGFKVKNILDGDVVWQQEGYETMSYKKGREYSLSLQYSY